MPGMARRVPPQALPRLLKAEEMVPAIEQFIKDHRELIDKIVSTVDNAGACFDNVIRPVVDIENAQQGPRSVIQALKFVSTEEDLQTAANQAERLWNEYSAWYRQDMYKLVKAVHDRNEVLDYESKKLLDKLCKKYRHRGFGLLNEEQIQQVEERTNEINQLCTKVRVMIQGDQSGLSLPAEDLGDIPPSSRKESQAPDGTEFWSFKRADLNKIMKHVPNVEIRKRMLEGYHANRIAVAPYFRRILLLRDENARALGFENHAAIKISERFAPSVEWVEEMLSSLEEALAPITKAEVEQVKAKEQLVKGTDTKIADIEPVDFQYYQNMVHQETLVDSNLVAQYYSLYPTFHAMLDVFAHCFRLKFDPLPREQLLSYVWHEDVLGWALWDERPESNGEFIGYLFADLVARPKKYKGYQSANLQPSYLERDGTRIYPANTIMCAFPEGKAETGCLLNYRTASVMFHELGHSIHDLVARTQYAQFHGYRVPWELCEGIGSMLQAFCFYPEIMRAMSQHYTRISPVYAESWLKANPGCDLPPKTISDELLLPASSQGGVTAGSMRGALIKSLFDIAVHNPPSQQALEDLDEVKLFKDIHERIGQRKFPFPSYTYLDGSTLVSGYDAGEYSYVCSELIAADILASKFATDPLSQEAWDEFRRCILVYGGSRDEVEMLKEYMGGRSIDPKAIVSVLK